MESHKIRKYAIAQAGVETDAGGIDTEYSVDQDLQGLWDMIHQADKADELDDKDCNGRQDQVFYDKTDER